VTHNKEMLTIGLIETPAMIAAAGNPPKRIAEYVGRLNTRTKA
jgi:hypothetical protein